MTITKEKVNYILGSLKAEDLAEMVKELQTATGDFDDLIAHLNNEEFFNSKFTEPYRAVLAVRLGKGFKYEDDYVLFDGSNNVYSLSEYEYNELLKSSGEDIVKTYLEQMEYGAVTERRDTITELLEELSEEEL